MGFFEFMMGVVVVGTIGGIVQQGMKLEREKIRARRGEADGEAAAMGGVVTELRKDVTRLKERVRVLEKLVTDDDRRLADEIDRLRRSDMESRP